MENNTTLDSAWNDAEAVLPEGGELFLSSNLAYPPERRYEAEAGPRVASEDHTGITWRGVPFQSQVGYGPTPVAALQALIAKLREVNGK